MHLGGSPSLTTFSAKDGNEPHQGKGPNSNREDLGRGGKDGSGKVGSQEMRLGPTLSLVPGDERQGIFSCLLDLEILRGLRHRAPGSPQEDGLFMVPGLGEKDNVGDTRGGGKLCLGSHS